MRTFITRARPWAILAALLAIAAVVATGTAGQVLAVAAVVAAFVAALRLLANTRGDVPSVERAGVGMWLGGGF